MAAMPGRRGLPRSGSFGREAALAAGSPCVNARATPHPAVSRDQPLGREPKRRQSSRRKSAAPFNGLIPISGIPCEWGEGGGSRGDAEVKSETRKKADASSASHRFPPRPPREIPCCFSHAHRHAKKRYEILAFAIEDRRGGIGEVRRDGMKPGLELLSSTRLACLPSPPSLLYPPEPNPGRKDAWNLSIPGMAPESRMQA